MCRYDAINGLPAVQQSITFEKVRGSFDGEFLLDYLNLCMHINCFSFTGMHCLQHCGTAQSNSCSRGRVTDAWQDSLYLCIEIFLTSTHTHTHVYTHTLKDRSSVLGADLAIEELEKAIGALKYMKTRFSNSPTADMSDELLSFLSDLMKVRNSSYIPLYALCQYYYVNHAPGDTYDHQVWDSPML